MSQDEHGDIDWVKVVVAYLLFKVALLVAVHLSAG